MLRKRSGVLTTPMAAYTFRELNQISRGSSSQAPALNQGSLGDPRDRVAAAWRQGLETVETQIRRGSRRDALRYAATAGAAERGISPEEAASYIERRGQVLR